VTDSGSWMMLDSRTLPVPHSSMGNNSSVEKKKEIRLCPHVKKKEKKRYLNVWMTGTWVDRWAKRT
jgi:hypothetical protein